MKIEISELSDKNYFLEDKLKHSELNKFLSEKVKVNKRWFFYVYMIITISPLSIISYTITKNLLTEELTIVNCLIHVFLGIIISILFIPIHELIHYLAYKITGAKSVSFYSNFKKLYFATIADKFVINLSEFTFVAILPFASVLIGTLISFPFLSLEFQLTAMIFLFIHTIFCSGDFTLLNYLASNKEMLTYDDKEKGETYFYKKQNG
jgi:hypothetical protein